MGIFDFVKKIFSEGANKDEGKESLDFFEIGNWIDEKKGEIEAREEKVFVLIQERIDVFINELREKSKIAESVDINLKKAEDRIKSVTEEGREKYLESVEIFINALSKLEKDHLEEFSKKVDKIFLNFNKGSYKNYERATILIGKEMANVKETLKIFSKEFIKIFEENKDITNSLSVFFLVKLKLEEIFKVSTELEKINVEVTFLDKDLIEKEEENKKIQKEIEEIKKSEDYLENLSKQSKIQLLKEELEREIHSLGQAIDFKALANFYHVFEGQMKLVKNYRDDFQRKFKEDNGKVILDLLNESKLNNKNISSRIENINNKKEEIIKNENEIKEDKTGNLYSKTTRIILDIGNLKNEKIRKEKRREKLIFQKKEKEVEIKVRMEDMGVEVGF